MIHRAVSNARLTLIEVMITVVIVIVIFLWHFPSAAIPVVTIRVTILLTFIPLHFAGVSINIMSLAGIAIACGELVDAALVVVEQTHKKLEIYERSGKPFSHGEVILAAVKEVAGPTFFALLVIAVAFLPILALEGQEGKLFRPLAYTKNFAMLVAAALAITLTPALRLLLVRNRPILSSAGSRLQRLLDSLLGGKNPITRGTPHHRAANAYLRPRRALDPALENAGNCGGDRPRFPGDSHVLDARLGVHASSGRRLPRAYAYHDAGHFHRGVAETSPIMSWAKRDARILRPMRRHSPCSKLSSCSNRNRNGGMRTPGTPPGRHAGPFPFYGTSRPTTSRNRNS